MASVNSSSQGSHAGRFSYDVLTGKWDCGVDVFLHDVIRSVTTPEE